VSVNVPSLLIVFMPANSRADPNYSLGTEIKKMSMKTCRWWHWVLRAVYMSVTLAYIWHVFLVYLQINMCSWLMLILLCL